MIASHPAKVKVLSMGRRWGKTVLGGALALSTASSGGKVAWVVPEYKNGRALWRWCENTVAPLKKYKVSSNRSERTVDFPNGGFLGIFSADNEDSIRSESFDLVILDEAARISETAWTDAIMPTLADRDGDAILISTPRGQNWFWNEYQRGISSDELLQKSWTAPTSANPDANIQKAFLLAKQRVPEITFRQEWLGEFVNSEGMVFRRIHEAAILDPLDGPLEGHQYSAGVDVASSVDYTVITVMDSATKEMVWMDRFNRVDYPVLEDRILSAYRRWNLDGMVVESNSMGQGVIDHLREYDLNIIAFTTTSVSKQDVIQRLQSVLEHGLIKIINDPVLVGELLSYESKRTNSGNYTYSAPEGQHDDCVMSLAFAVYGIFNDTWLIS
jgi:phage terminase large subunit-like protein